MRLGSDFILAEARHLLSLYISTLACWQTCSGDKVRGCMFENIAVDNVDVGLRGEALAQRLDQPMIQLDGHNAAGAFGQRLGQHAFASADLQHTVGWRQRRRSEDRR